MSLRLLISLHSISGSSGFYRNFNIALSTTIKDKKEMPSKFYSSSLTLILTVRQSVWHYKLNYVPSFYEINAFCGRTCLCLRLFWGSLAALIYVNYAPLKYSRMLCFSLQLWSKSRISYFHSWCCHWLSSLIALVHLDFHLAPYPITTQKNFLWNRAELKWNQYTRRTVISWCCSVKSPGE